MPHVNNNVSSPSNLGGRKDSIMLKTNICTINDKDYYLGRDENKKDFILFLDGFPIVKIVRKDLVNWKGSQVRFRPFSSPADLDYLDEDGLFALDEALLYLKENFGA